MVEVTSNYEEGEDWLSIVVSITDCPRPQGLSLDEWVALNLLTAFSQKMSKVCSSYSSMEPHRSQGDCDWNEAAIFIHHLQTMLLSQIAAKMNPELFRGLGRVFGFDRGGKREKA